MVVQVMNKVGKYGSRSVGWLFGDMSGFLRRCLFRVLSVGPIPSHFAFIMDGNRRYAKKQFLEEGVGHKAGFTALMSMLNFCYELGVKYVTVYAFSIENFKRNPGEVQSLMDLMLEKIEALLKEESIVNQYGIRVYFIGNLKLLVEPVRAAAEEVMKATANNNKTVLLVCVAYTSCDEIVHAVQDSCEDKFDEIQGINRKNACNRMIEEREMDHKTNIVSLYDVKESCKDGSGESQVSRAITGCNGHHIQGFSECKCNEVETFKSCIMDESASNDVEGSEKQHSVIKLTDVEKHMYMAVAPDPDILIRSSGEARLSNFLLWQTSHCPLYSPTALWPEIGLWHLVWTILTFQRTHSYLEKKKKKQV
ncbi:hypothetical protein SLA2020_019390 [Shorea laevis]